jgi:hypothetical protein
MKNSKLLVLALEKGKLDMLVNKGQHISKEVLFVRHLLTKLVEKETKKLK